MPALELLSIAALSVFLGLLLKQLSKNARQQQQLDIAFYQLLETHNGYISLIQLAAAAKVDAQAAKEYLETQAQAFDASLEVDADGDTFYRFPKLHRD
ncbi:hypothetical protein H6G20_24140 [Desertifilum sp. FACHB-1129]|uniref:Uncharacterized protein n=2 Tax=Desertifilum tharense IPPAS B-1220 TaxID=1781255 RepID=A0A1E5QGH0_9CYAN|nr:MULTISPECIES: hypothetical protein [Desertifilum]MDA0213267.1 hypothetical protein [Cyanobacteria bacterium FC1]MDI9638064.1 hypothetical protein [Geitlerinema splendidum]MDL5049852.1 hypothetical protein [Oscillatoria amoena NRMC-F 0135]MBD2314763.1 hypothetical protein [Desertifilum sp. FACHB-1129]MBD2323914.1 hypothetical protein [Desertifilum sp. FACHB-866]